MKGFKILGTLIFILAFAGCSSDLDETNGEGEIIFKFEHFVGGEQAIFDQIIYENAAGNEYEITNIQWFISDVTFMDQKGEELIISGDDWVHYIDSDIPDSHTWALEDGIPAGDYASIRFTFGIKGEKNQPNIFSDPPESNMIWPYHMGGDQGGYHYMKLNGFWNDIDAIRTPFNFHIGVGQMYDEDGDVIEFVQNWRILDIPASAFKLLSNETIELTIRMNIENWFKNPHIYDHNEYGGKIMSNQEAMGKIKENCDGVYTVSFKKLGGETAE
jgi:hypothetical protein